MMPKGARNFSRQTPEAPHPLLESGILLAAIVSAALNASFSGVGSAESAQDDASRVVPAVEHL
jgi:NCS2 family nucleobase:cation symporter-2